VEEALWRFAEGGVRRDRWARCVGVGGLLAVGCVVFLQGACSPVWKSTRPEPPPSRTCAPCSEVLLPEGYAEVLALMEKDRRAEARSLLEAGIQSRSPEETRSAAVFELAAALLLEQTDPARLKAFQEAFQRYALSLPPEEAGRGYADRILRILDVRIRQAERERRRTGALQGFVEQQQKELEDLEYKLRKLEEIQQETEQKREDFLHK